MTETQKTTFQVGEIVKFIGYDEEVEDPILEAGLLYYIDRIGADNVGNPVHNLLPIGDDNKPNGEDGDQVFVEEIEKVEQPVDVVGEAVETAPEPEAQVEEDTQTEVEAAPEPALETPAEEPAGDEQSLESEQEAAPPAEASDDFDHDPIVLDMIRKSNNLEELAASLSDQQQEMNYLIGGVITEIHRNKLHVTAGYEDSSDGFAKYVADTIGPERRKCYGLMNIYKTFRQRGLCAADIRGIGWTKALILARASAELMEELLPSAREMTRGELEDAVTEGRSATTEGAETINRKTYKFTLYGDQNTLVEQAINWAKTQIEEDDPKRVDSAAFEFICTQIVTMVMDAPTAGDQAAANGAAEEMTEAPLTPQAQHVEGA